MKPDVLSSTLTKMTNHKHLRKLLARKIDNFVYKSVVNDESEDLECLTEKTWENEYLKIRDTVLQ